MIAYCAHTDLKSPSEMDVAPWIAHWILTVSDGIQWSRLASDGLSQLIRITIEWFKTPKPIIISGMGWDGANNMALTGEERQG